MDKNLDCNLDMVVDATIENYFPGENIKGEKLEDAAKNTTSAPKSTESASTGVDSFPCPPEEIGDTETIDKARARQKFEAAKAWFTNNFPKAFNFKEPVPLKVDIHKDIMALEAPFSRVQRTKVIRWYVYGPPYLKAVINGQWRHDLNGNPVEQISAEQKAYAMEQYRLRKKRSKEKKIDRS